MQGARICPICAAPICSHSWPDLVRVHFGSDVPDERCWEILWHETSFPLGHIDKIVAKLKSLRAFEDYDLGISTDSGDVLVQVAFEPFCHPRPFITREQIANKLRTNCEHTRPYPRVSM